MILRIPSSGRTNGGADASQMLVAKIGNRRSSSSSWMMNAVSGVWQPKAMVGALARSKVLS